MSAKIKVHLTPELRRELTLVSRSQKVPAAKSRRARVLLLADEDHADGQRPDTYIAAALGLSEKQVKVIRQKFVREGLPALERKRRSTPATKPKFDGRAEAQLVTLCCSTPPDGRQRWTLQLLADELCRLQVVTSVCCETVRQCLKKTGCSLGGRNASAFPRRTMRDSSPRWNRCSTSTAETYEAQHRLICMDEAAKQVVSDVEPALPMTPGQPRCEDHHYDRQGVQAVFAFFDPLEGWRRVTSRDSRTRRDWAEEVRRLLDVDCPEADLVTLVCDNLNTHDIASLYATFDAATAHRLARRLRIVHTPRNGSWLNMAEMELSVLTRQCLGRRFDSLPEMRAAMAAWQHARNAAKCGADWRFTTADARIQLKSLYPKPEVLG